jgi:hypothetical protein
LLVSLLIVRAPEKVSRLPYLVESTARVCRAAFPSCQRLYRWMQWIKIRNCASPRSSHACLRGILVGMSHGDAYLAR